jgi:hypothetical protein
MSLSAGIFPYKINTCIKSLFASTNPVFLKKKKAIALKKYLILTLDQSFLLHHPRKMVLKGTI